MYFYLDFVLKSLLWGSPPTPHRLHADSFSGRLCQHTTSTWKENITQKLLPGSTYNLYLDKIITQKLLPVSTYKLYPDKMITLELLPVSMYLDNYQEITTLNAFIDSTYENNNYLCRKVSLFWGGQPVSLRFKLELVNMTNKMIKEKGQ